MSGEGGRFNQKEDRQAEHVKEREVNRPRPQNTVEPIGHGTIPKQKGQKQRGKK